MQSDRYYWMSFKEDPRHELKPGQFINGEVYVVGSRDSIPLELFENISRVKPVNNMKTVYIAGAYRWRGSKWVPSVIGEIINIYKAWKVARDVWLAGFVAICPHTNSLLMDRFGTAPEIFLKGDLDILRQCDYILMMPEWQKSSGATMERAFAMQLGIPVFYSVETLKAESSWQ